MERMDGEMKTNARRIRIALLAMMMSLAMTMSAFACDDYDDLWGYDAYEGPEAYDDYWYDECDWEEDCGDEFYDEYYGNYDYDYDCYYDYDEDYDGIFYDTDFCFLSQYDFTEYSVEEPNVISFDPLPSKVGSTNAVISAFVSNPEGRTIDAVGCTLYYSYGSVVTSAKIPCDCDYTGFDITFDINEDLYEELSHGGIYDYRMFVEADNEIYTMECDRFETNMVDDNIIIERGIGSITASTVIVDADIYNPTGMTIDEIGCRFGEGSLETDKDVDFVNSSDDFFCESFMLSFPGGHLVEGKTYSYEVYVVSGGHEYSIGVESFTA